MIGAEGRPPPTFVLVHGAFHGGWCWKAIGRLLRAAGHEVYTPTQTGLGERSHLLSSDITIDTFVTDITNVILWEELDDVILVGHSFGGRTISGVADRIPKRIRRLIYLDAGLPRNGESRLDGMEPQARDARISAAVENDGGLSVPPPPAARFDMIDPEQIKQVERLLTPQPLSAERTPLNLRHPLGNGLPVTFVHFNSPALAVTLPSAEYAKRRSDWRFLELPAGHNAIITHPEDVAKLLLGEVSC